MITLVCLPLWLKHVLSEGRDAVCTAYPGKPSSSPGWEVADSAGVLYVPRVAFGPLPWLLRVQLQLMAHASNFLGQWLLSQGSCLSGMPGSHMVCYSLYPHPHPSPSTKLAAHLAKSRTPLAGECSAALLEVGQALRCSPHSGSPCRVSWGWTLNRIPAYRPSFYPSGLTPLLH